MGKDTIGGTKEKKQEGYMPPHKATWARDGYQFSWTTRLSLSHDGKKKEEYLGEIEPLSATPSGRS